MQQIMGNEDVFESDGLKMMTFPLIKSNSLGGFPERKKKKGWRDWVHHPILHLQSSPDFIRISVHQGMQWVSRNSEKNKLQRDYTESM